MGYANLHTGTSDLALGETSTDAYRGDRGKTAYDHSQTGHGSLPVTRTGGNTARTFQSFLDAPGISVEDHGAVGNGSTDDAAAINAANTAATAAGVPLLFTPGKTYRINSGVAFTTNVFGEGAIITVPLDSNFCAVTVGETSAYFSEKTVLLPKVRRTKTGLGWGSTTSSIGVKLLNVEGCYIKFDTITNFYYGIHQTSDASLGGAYNEIHLPRLSNNKIGLYVRASNTTSWVNEQNYHGGSAYITAGETSTGTRLMLLASYPSGNMLDGLHFYGFCFEGEGEVEYPLEIAGASGIEFFGGRYETTTGAYIAGLDSTRVASNIMFVGGHLLDSFPLTIGTNSSNVVKKSTSHAEGTSDARTLQTYAPETIITNWQSGHGWSNQTTSDGTQSDDTEVFYRGIQSVKYVTKGNSAACITRKTGLTINATGKMLKFYVRIDNPSGLQELWIAATSDSWSNYWTWKLSVDMTQIKNGNVWVPLTIPFLNAVITGTPNRAAITAIQIRIKDTGSAVTVNYGALALVQESLSAGVCTISFDDGWESQYTQALLKMAQSGLPGVAYIIPDLVGTAGYMTEAQILEMQNIYGWDIGSHHQTNLTTVGSVEGVSNICEKIKKYMTDKGFKARNHFAYANGAYDESIVLPVVRQYFSSARTIASYMAETIPAPDWHRLRVMLVTNTTTTTAIANAVTAAITGKYWLHLVFHKIVASPSASTEYSIANFGTVIDNIVSQGIAVRTLTQLEDYIGYITPSGISYSQTGSTTPETLQTLLDANGVRPEAFGAVGNGSTDDTSALNAANTYAAANGKNLILSGRYSVTSDLTFTAPVNFVSEYSYITVATTKTVTYSEGLSALPMFYCLRGAGVHRPKKILYSYLEWWGGKADSASGNSYHGTNCSAALQAALDAKVAGGPVPVLLDGGYYINTTITLMDSTSHPGEPTILLGSNRDLTGTYERGNCFIECDVSPLFVTKTTYTSGSPYDVKLTVKNVCFKSHTGGNVMFQNVDISVSKFQDNLVVGFGSVFDMVSGVTEISGNHFMDMRDTLMRSVSPFYQADVQIHHNYFNGNSSLGNVAILKLTGGSGFMISDNYFDFCKYGIHLYYTGGATAGRHTIHGNIFDICYRGIYIQESDDTSITGNVFLRNDLASRASYMPNNPNSAWGCIEIVGVSNNITITGNTYSIVDRFIILTGDNIWNITESANVGAVGNWPMIDWTAKTYTAIGTYPLDGQNIISTSRGIERLEKATDYTILPSDTCVVHTSGTAHAFTLPPARLGKDILIKNIGSGTLTLQADPGGADTIEDSSLAQGESLRLIGNKDDDWEVY